MYVRNGYKSRLKIQNIHAMYTGGYSFIGTYQKVLF